MCSPARWLTLNLLRLLHYTCRNHYISPQQFGSNVQRIMDAGKKAGISKFLLITPPPVCEACKGKTPVSEVGFQCQISVPLSVPADV